MVRATDAPTASDYFICRRELTSGAGRNGGRASGEGPPFPRRIRRVNRMGRERRISLYYVASPIRLLKPRDVSNHCPDRYCGPGGRHRRSRLRRRRTRRSAIYFPIRRCGRRAPSRAAVSNSAAAISRRRRGSAGTAARPAAADPESAPAGAGRTAARKRPVATVAASARNRAAGTSRALRFSRRSPASRALPTRRRAAVPGLPPGQRQPKGVPQTPATLQPGDEVVSEPPATKITNKKASFSGLDKITGRIINFDEDIGETVQFGALRVKNQRLLYAAVHRGCQHRRLRRGRRDHAAGRGEADILGLDVCRKSRPARRRAPGLRHLADRLQRARPDHRQRGARTAEGRPAAGAEACAAAEAGCSASAGTAAAAAIPAAAASAATTAAATARRVVWWLVRELSARRDDRERVRAADRLAG